METVKNITVIPARRRVGNTAKESEIPKLRVAAYCRVSTDSDEQATSYEAQVEHYTDYIRKNLEWEFAGIFADDGISGTNTKKREEFNRMIDEAMAGKIDMIVTKSISRFARNTLACLKYISQLKEKNTSIHWTPPVKYCLPSWRVLHSRKASPYHRMSSWVFSTAISRDRLL